MRNERKPYLLEAMVSRLRGHSSASGANFVKDEIDCLARWEERLAERQILTRSQMDQRREQYTKELGEAAARVRGEAPPSPASAFDYVFADRNIVGEDV